MKKQDQVKAMTMPNTDRFTCVICGYLTIDELCAWEICPVCFWEDDTDVDDGIDNWSSPNRSLFVSEAQANYLLFGVSYPPLARYVRPPLPEEHATGRHYVLKEAKSLYRQYVNTTDCDTLPGYSVRKLVRGNASPAEVLNARDRRPKDEEFAALPKEMMQTYLAGAPHNRLCALRVLAKLRLPEYILRRISRPLQCERDPQIRWLGEELLQRDS